jgi:hypothetical protein
METRERLALVDRLKALVGANTERLAKAAEPSECRAEPVSLSELKDIHWLADTLQAEQKPPNRWPLILIFGVTALVLSFLLTRPSTIAIVLHATTAEVAFGLSPGSELQNDVYLISKQLPITTLELFGSARAIPSTDVNLDSAVLATEWTDLRFEHVYLRVAPKKVPKLTLTAEAPSGVRLCIQDSELFLDLAGTKTTDSQGDREFQIRVSPVAHASNAPATNSEACVRWESASRDALTVLSNLPISDLHVSGSDVRVAGENERADIFPTALKSARLIFPEAPGLRQVFDADERLGLTNFVGRLTSLSLSKGFLEVSANGRADSATKSSGLVEKSIVPSRLTIYKARYSELWFAWGLLLYLVGLVTAFLKWRGVDL